MGEFEDRINSVLSDPGQMEKIAKLAKSFMAGGEKQAESPAEDTSAGSTKGSASKRASS